MGPTTSSTGTDGCVTTGNEGIVTTGKNGEVAIGDDGVVTTGSDDAGGTVEVTRTPDGVTITTGAPDGDDVDVVGAKPIERFDSANCADWGDCSDIGASALATVLVVTVAPDCATSGNKPSDSAT